MNQRRQTAKKKVVANSLSDLNRLVPVRTVIAAGVVFGWTLLVFLPATHYEFVDYDDREAYLDNPEFRGLGARHLGWMFTTYHMGHYQPLTWVTLGLDALIARHALGDDLDPRPYHATNIVLHVFSALLVFFLARKLFALSAPGSGWELDAASALAALVFAVHPLRAESVAWVTERRDVLSSFLLLATVWLYLAAHNTDRPRSALMFGGMLSYLLSLLSRAMGVTLPIILLLLDVFVLRRLASNRTGRSTTFRGLLVEKIPFVVLAAPFIVLAPLAQREVGAAWSWQGHGPLARLAQACYGLVHYLWKTFVPTGLSPIYELTRPIDPLAPKYLASFAVVSILAATLWRLRRRFPSLWCAAGCYVVLLLPVLGLFQSGDQEVADRYSYLPGIVLAMTAAGAVLRAWEWRPSWKIPGTFLGVVVALALSLLTARQCAIWKNSTALWSYGQSVAPNSAIAQAGYSTVLLEQGRYADAEVHARRAIGIVPRNWQAHQNIWKALQGLGKEDELIAALNDSIRLEVMAEEAHNNLGNAYARRSAFEKAAAEYRAAIVLRPGYAKAHANLASVLLRLGNLPDAEQEARRAVEADPNFALARFNLAAALERLGRRDEAAASYREAMRLDPQMTAAGRALQRLGG